MEEGLGRLADRVRASASCSIAQDGDSPAAPIGHSTDAGPVTPCVHSGHERIRNGRCVPSSSVGTTCSSSSTADRRGGAAAATRCSSRARRASARRACSGRPSRKAEAAGIRVEGGIVAPQDRVVPLASIRDLAAGDAREPGLRHARARTCWRSTGRHEGDALGSRRILVRAIADRILEAIDRPTLLIFDGPALGRRDEPRGHR